HPVLLLNCYQYTKQRGMTEQDHYATQSKVLSSLGKSLSNLSQRTVPVLAGDFNSTLTNSERRRMESLFTLMRSTSFFSNMPRPSNRGTQEQAPQTRLRQHNLCGGFITIGRLH
ncbi:unnamed protein product, partial [Symbiodinium natans]